MSFFRAGILVWALRFLMVACANYVSATAFELILVLIFPLSIDAVLCARIAHMRRASDLGLSWRAQTLDQKVVAMTQVGASEGSRQEQATAAALESGVSARYKEV